MREVVSREPSTRHLIIGAGQERAKLEARIKELDLADHVFLLGSVDEAARYLKAADLFILASRSEGMPYVLLEALIAGVPVVALEKYDGSPVDAVKVGTIKRAKGLEFKQVLIPDLRRDQTTLNPPAGETEHERWDLTRRELYVAMTRARDGLWVGISR